MFNLEPRSVLILSAGMALLMSGVMLIIRSKYLPSIQGLTEWAFAPLLAFAGMALMAALGKLPFFVTSAAGLTCVLAAMVTIHFGTLKFFGHKPNFWRWGLLLAVCAGLFTWFSIGSYNFAAMVFVFSAALAFMLFCSARLMQQSDAKDTFTRATGWLTTLIGLSQVFRAAEALAGLGMDGPLSRSAYQTANLMVLALGCPLMTMGLVLMVTERMRAGFEHLATHDTLTGALTRRAMVAACENELERASRNGNPTALLMVDLDHFKRVNDNFGHATGDKTLVEFAAGVRKLLRKPDLLARFGGEEFVVLLLETSLQEAAQVAERIRVEQALAQGNGACTVSMGVSAFAPVNTVGPAAPGLARNSAERCGSSPAEVLNALLSSADRALYRAKGLGRNRVEIEFITI